MTEKKNPQNETVDWAERLKASMNAESAESPARATAPTAEEDDLAALLRAQLAHRAESADAFTYAHNSTFPTDLEEHREYEAALQDHFLEYLQADPQVDTRMAKSVMDAIYSYHREYITQPADIRRDAQFALTACCCVLAILFTPRIL